MKLPATVLVMLSLGLAFAQQPSFGGRGGGRGARGGIPGATPEQTQAISDMNTVLAPLSAAVDTGRTELANATFAGTGKGITITAAVEKLKAAELALATKRSEEFAKIQAGPNRLNPDQVSALIAQVGQGRGGSRGPGGPRN